MISSQKKCLCTINNKSISVWLKQYVDYQTAQTSSWHFHPRNIHFETQRPFRFFRSLKQCTGCLIDDRIYPKNSFCAVEEVVHHFRCDSTYISAIIQLEHLHDTFILWKSIYKLNACLDPCLPDSGFICQITHHLFHWFRFQYLIDSFWDALIL